MFFPTIGLEIHIELNTKSKMFCSCKNDPAELEPNKNICPVCMAYPGVLPVANEEAIKKLLITAIALDCEIANKSFFERKNYFYPDLPKGYQISQYQAPLAKNGRLDILEGKKRVHIERIHLEEDTARLQHPDNSDFSLVDFNRAGVPLMELVSCPDIHSANEAKDFVKELQLLLRKVNASNSDMEKGQLRCEVNISLAQEGAEKLGTKVEIKNLNSLRSVEKSIEYEIKRQNEMLERGEKVVQETRGFHDIKQITFSQRLKEQAHDYRYFPEPDLPPFSFSKDYLQKIKAAIPELPQAKRERLTKEYGLTLKEANLYVENDFLSAFYEAVISELNALKPKEPQKAAKTASNYLSTDLQSLLKEAGDGELKISSENFAEFIALIVSGEISSKIAKDLLKEMFASGADPSQLIASKGLKQMGDPAEIENIIKEVIKENPQPAQDYKVGKEASLQFLVGCVMSKTKGKANPLIVIELLKKQLAF